MAGSLEWVLPMQQDEAAKEQTDVGKKQARRCFSDAVLALSKVYALAAASDDARKIRDVVGFFQSVRMALMKNRTVTNANSPSNSWSAGRSSLSAVLIWRMRPLGSPHLVHALLTGVHSKSSPPARFAPKSAVRSKARIRCESYKRRLSELNSAFMSQSRP